MTVPCIDCITLPICKASYNEFMDNNLSISRVKSFPPIPLMKKCTLIRYYMYRVDRESDDRELVPRNSCLNINNVHIFFQTGTAND